MCNQKKCITWFSALQPPPPHGDKKLSDIFMHAFMILEPEEVRTSLNFMVQNQGNYPC